MPNQDPVRELVSVMAALRGEDGCPWDREQDHQSLRQYLVEEAYELLDAIDAEDDAAMADELGDVLLQVVFHCQIAAEDQRFDLDDVAARLVAKLRRRHPHVFGETAVADAAGVVRQWEAIKQSEPAGRVRTSALDGVPRHLPALAQAEKLQKKAAKLGFDWPDLEGPLAKIREELAELDEARAAGDAAGMRHEVGDLLFALANVARFLDVDPEDALRQCNGRFRSRFRHVETRVAASGRPWAEHDLAELDHYWEEAKVIEREELGSPE